MRTIAEWASALPGDEGVLALSYLLNTSPGRVRARRGEALPDDVAAAYEAVVQRRKGGMPLQYAIGRWEFYGHEFLVDPRALIPRPETERLVEMTLAEGIDGKRVVDIGTGSGAIAISLALEARPAEIIATDISAQALALAKENAHRLLGTPAENVLQWALGDGPGVLPDGLDVIVSNPPYIDPKERPALQRELAYEPAGALFAGESGAGGTAVYEAWIPQIYEKLAEGGVVLFEIGDLQGPALKDLLEAAGFSECEIRQDYTGRDRVARAKKPAANPEEKPSVAMKKREEGSLAKQEE